MRLVRPSACEGRAGRVVAALAPRDRPPGIPASPDPAPDAPGPGMLQALGGRCPACGIAFAGVAGAGTGVLRVDRAQWRSACPGAARLAAPAACRILRAALSRAR